MKLTVGLVGPVAPPAGGMAAQTAQLRDLLVSEGVDVLLVPTNAPYRPAIVANVRGLRALFRLLPYVVRLWRCAGDVDVLHVMANSGWSWHLFAAPAIWIGRLRATRVVVNYRGGGAGPFLSRHGAIVAPTLARADAIVVPSGFLKDIFAQYDFATVVVPNIIDRARFHPSTCRTPGARVLIARALESIYDVGSGIRAFAQLKRSHPAARLTIAGEGPERRALEQLVEALDLREAVSFTGVLDRDEMARVMRESDILLNPSRVDNMPNSVLEALASGVAVVSTDVGGVVHVVQHERTALLVPAGDYETMGAAMSRLADDDALRERLQANGLADVEQYTWPRVRPRLFALYRNIVAAPGVRERSSDQHVL